MDVYTAGYLENHLGFLAATRPGARLTHLAVYIDHGVKDERPEHNGISHLIEHVIFNLNRFPRHLAMQWEPLKRQGARFEAWTGKEYTRIGFSFSPEGLRQALTFVRRLLEKPPLNKDALLHERQIVLDEIARKRSRPEFLWSLVEEALYAPPYGLPILGKPETVAKLELAQLRETLSRVLVPGRVRLVLTGRVMNDVTTLIADIFGTWDAPFRNLEPPPVEVMPKMVAIPGSGSRVSLYLAFPAPSLTDPARHAAEVVASILSHGLGSRVFRKLREERGLAYGVGGGSVHWHRSGYIVLFADLARERLGAAFRCLLEIIDGLKTHAIQPDEVATAGEGLALNALQEAEGPGLAHRLGLHWLAGEMYYPSRAAIAYKNVTPADITRGAASLDPQRMALVGVGIDENELTQLLEVKP